MRKTNKSALYSLFPILNEKPATDFKHVLDGGFLLRKFVWERGQQTFRQICEGYISFVRRHYGANCVIVFDGYGKAATKSVE